MNNKAKDWILFGVLCLVWGSSFILMKAGLVALNPFQVAAWRILSAGLVLLPFFLKATKEIPKAKRWLVIFSGVIGSFIPAFLFCIAETKLDSSLAGILNALTPLFTIVIGILFFKMKAGWKKIVGVLLGFTGLYFLITVKGHIDFKNGAYSALLLLATFLYGINLNLVGHFLKGISPMNIVSFAFGCLILPCVGILAYTGYFNLAIWSKPVLLSTVAGCVLGMMGTALATVLFYQLLKSAGRVFASMVTYGIPFVAVIFGLFIGEQITVSIILSLGIILTGVYIANKQ